MENKLKLALQKAAMGVFEELTFMLPSRDLNEAQLQAPFQMAASVDFVGPLSGKFIMAVFGDLIAMMAANMLGEMEVPSDFQQRDALKELANVMCGNMLPHLIGEAAVYTISAPAIIEDLVQFSRIHGTPTEHLQLGLELGRADLQIFLSGDKTSLETQT